MTLDQIKAAILRVPGATILIQCGDQPDERAFVLYRLDQIRLGATEEGGHLIQWLDHSSDESSVYLAAEAMRLVRTELEKLT